MQWQTSCWRNSSWSDMGRKLPTGYLYAQSTATANVIMQIHKRFTRAREALLFHSSSSSSFLQATWTLDYISFLPSFHPSFMLQLTGSNYYNVSGEFPCRIYFSFGRFPGRIFQGKMEDLKERDERATRLALGLKWSAFLSDDGAVAMWLTGADATEDLWYRGTNKFCSQS